MNPLSAEEKAEEADAAAIKNFLRSLLPGRADLLTGLRRFIYILVGGIALYPLMVRLPVLGWDWYFFFNANHPVDNIFNPNGPFFPYTRYIIALLTWMPWRDSLAILGGLSYMSAAIGTWVNGGRYRSIVLALFNPLPILALWVGHPDGLALMGMVTGFIPLALIKPQITFWSYLRSKPLIAWTGAFLAAVILIWPGWLHTAPAAHWDHPASFGWQALGWPMLLVGAALMAGAGKDPWKLMAAGCFITPDLMVYHLIVLLPAIGRVQKGWKLVVWGCTWLLIIGTGMGGVYRFANLLLPLTIYMALQTPQGYKAAILEHMAEMRRMGLWAARQVKAQRA